MKKVIIITLLMSVLATLFIGSGVCFADESQANYYYVAKDSELNVRMSPSEEGKIIMQIPSTYAFEYVDKADGFVKIKYNGCEGYVSEVYFTQYCKAVTSKWGDNSYYYSISLTMTNIKTDQLTLYNKDNMSPYDPPFPTRSVSIDKVYGYYHNESGYYFLVDTTTSVYGTTIKNTGYIKASDTTLADFTKDAIPENAGYAAEIAVTEPSGGNGDDTTPTITPNDGDPSTTPATNNFERYVLIAVIAVLCIVIIILIFAPNKSKRKPQ